MMRANLDLLTLYGFYISILAIIFLYLSGQVNICRRYHLGRSSDNKNSRLSHAMQARTNFAEYVPFASVMILVVSQITAPIMLGSIKPMSIMGHTLFLLLILGRLCHAYGMLYQNQQAAKTSWQMPYIGQFLTLSVIILATLILLLHFIYSLAQ